MQQSSTKRQWESLSTDLWAAIFLHLQPKLDSKFLPGLPWRFTQKVRRFYKLRTVCLKFEKVFSQNSQLYSTWGLARSLEGHHLANMFSWVKQYGDNLEELVSTTAASWLDVTLTALLALQSPGHLSRLSTVSSVGLTLSLLPLLAQFRSIATCCLDCNPQGASQGWPNDFSLSPFEDLPHLTHLTLAAVKAQNLEAAQHLTCLELSGSQATCSTPSACVLILLQLQVWESTLTGLHPEGLAACCNLLHLGCSNACVSAMDTTNDLECRTESAARLPSNLQTMKALTGLTFGCRGSMTRQLQFDCLALLPTLEHLHVSCVRPMQGLHLPECLSRLTNLSYLFIHSGHSAGQMRLDFAWSNLVALQDLTLSGSLRSKHALSDLMYLGRLKDISLYIVGNSDGITTSDAGQLAYSMGIKRPEINLCLRENYP